MQRKGLRAVISCNDVSRAAACDAAKACSSAAPGANDAAARVTGADASLCIVKYHTERTTLSGANAAHPVTQIHTIHPTCARHRAVMYGEDDRVSPAQRHHLGSGLHARALFSHDELTAGEVLVRLREQDHQLQRKHTLPVEILVQAVVVPGAVVQQ